VLTRDADTLSLIAGHAKDQGREGALSSS
jgi:hypothetical protein